MMHFVVAHYITIVIVMIAVYHDDTLAGLSSLKNQCIPT